MVVMPLSQPIMIINRETASDLGLHHFWRNQCSMGSTPLGGYYLILLTIVNGYNPYQNHSAPLLTIIDLLITTMSHH